MMLMVMYIVLKNYEFHFVIFIQMFVARFNTKQNNSINGGVETF